MRALRNAGIPMQKLRRAADDLRQTQGAFVLARPVLFTDGIDLYLREHGDLYRIHDGQQPIEEVIRNYLSRVVLDDHEDPTAFCLPLDDGIQLVMDPLFNAGRPSLESTRTPAFAVLGALEAGEHPALIADDYSITIEEVAAIERHREWLAEVA
ncbi:Putative antitoxin VapB45 [Mycolicibacterium mageritense]|uniref:Antitoxin VapB45 n=2 Tax=Mycolicibacterium mageritense TaxID=53462 RepID=A0AAI8TZX7_MYCME|nr:Putative antitoxin VapB45 [Mycolicibacterium mageritense]